MGEGTKNILIVEDERTLAQALEAKMKKEGFQATIATNGEVALEHLRAGGVDFMILDLIMPKVDGFEVLRTMKEEGISVPLAVLSNLGQNQDVEQIKEFGVEDYFVKADIPIADVVEVIKRKLA